MGIINFFGKISDAYDDFWEDLGEGLGVVFNSIDDDIELRNRRKKLRELDKAREEKERLANPPELSLREKREKEQDEAWNSLTALEKVQARQEYINNPKCRDTYNTMFGEKNLLPDA